jgi:hypothetical protein
MELHHLDGAVQSQCGNEKHARRQEKSRLANDGPERPGE